MCIYTAASTVPGVGDGNERGKFDVRSHVADGLAMKDTCLVSRAQCILHLDSICSILINWGFTVMGGSVPILIMMSLGCLCISEQVPWIEQR